MRSFQPINRINILFVIMQMEMGGSERLVHNLVKHIDRNRFSPSVAWFFGKEPLDEYRQLAVPLFHVSKIKRVDFEAQSRLSRIIEENNIQVVNAHHFMSMVYASWGCMRHRAQMFYTEHSAWELTKVDLKWRLIGSQLLRKVRGGAIGVSRNVSKALQQTFWLPLEKVHTIQNGVDLRAFSAEPDRNAVRRELGFEKHHFVIGKVANLKKVKNHRLLLEAFDALYRQNKRVRLVLIGKSVPDDEQDGTEKEIRSFIEEKSLSGKITLLGFRNDVARLLSAFDVFCLTSLREGLPIGMIEAMAAGCPVVGTCVQGIRDVIVHEQNGLMVPQGAVKELCAVLGRLADDESLRLNLGKAARTMAERHFSLQDCISAHETLFSQARA